MTLPDCMQKIIYRPVTNNSQSSHLDRVSISTASISQSFSNFLKYETLCSCDVAKQQPAKGTSAASFAISPVDEWVVDISGCNTRLCGTSTQWCGVPVNAKHQYNICTMLDQRRRRWANVVQKLYKCFVSAGVGLLVIILFCLCFDRPSLSISLSSFVD